MMRKQEIVDLEIQTLAYPNDGIGFYGDKKIHVRNTIPGQKLAVRFSKRRRKIEGHVIEIIEKAANEINPKCNKFSLCGGCTYQNITYQDELKIKETMVLNLLTQGEITNFEFLGIEGAPEIEGYRNKMEYSFGDSEKDGDLSLGMRKRNSFYEVVTAPNCNIVDEDYRKILKAVLDFFATTDETFYHRTKHTGALRNLIIRKGKRTGEILINLVTTSSLEVNIVNLVELLNSLSLDGKIVGILHTRNNALSDAVICDDFSILFGRDYFFDTILGLSFKISAFSFFQTNSLAAEKLYETVRDFIGIEKNNLIFDLYCGTGTIAQIVSEKAKKVIGIEIVEEAVIAAKENAKLNHIPNCEFIAGDVLKEVSLISEIPDLIILDPPRDGIHPKAIDKIIDFSAKRIIYVSCKPTSLVRDLKIFIAKGYSIEKIKCHDLFSRTYHVETVVLMSKNYEFEEDNTVNFFV